MNDDSMQATLLVTKALADGQRLRILMMLRSGELCVCQIVETLALAPSTVSRHLSVLHAARLVHLRKAGRWAYYRLSNPPADAFVRPLLTWLQGALRDDVTIRRDAATLSRIRACDPDELCQRQRRRRHADDAGSHS